MKKIDIIRHKNYEIIPNKSVIIVTLDHRTVQGLVVSNEDNSLFLLQNTMGNTERYIGDMHGYRYAYAIRFYSSSNPILECFNFCKVTTYEMEFQSVVGQDPIDYSDITLPIYKEVRSHVKLTGHDNYTLYSLCEGRLIWDNGKVEPEEVSTTKLCKGRNHPDCCGSYLFYSFEENVIEISNSKYNSISDESLEIIRKKLIGNSGAARLVHLSHKQLGSIDFVKKLGMEEMFEYKNNNSGNMIKVFHKNPGKETD